MTEKIECILDENKKRKKLSIEAHNSQIIFSIVVPVYNVESYVEKCIKSLLSQNFNSYEILLINDGSTDSSLKICKKYVCGNGLIKLFNKENKGLADTRNYGLKKSRGEYVVFVDSDDYIEKDILRTLYNEICNNDYPDVLLYNYYLIEGEAKTEKKSYVTESGRLEEAGRCVISELKRRNLPVAACFGVYNRDFLVKNKLFFDVGILHEDERWTPQVLFAAREIYKSKTVFYNYVKRKNSITTKTDKYQNGIDLIETCKVLDSLIENCENTQLKLWFRNRIAMLYMKAVSMGKLYKTKRVNRILPIKYSCTVKDKMKSIIFMISLRLYCWLDKIF